MNLGRIEEGDYDRYVKAISSFSILTVDEEIALAKKIQSGDQDALHNLVSSNLRYVITIAKLFEGKGIKLENLINIANTGLVVSARQYQPDYAGVGKVKFISIAIPVIKTHIAHALTKLN